MPKLQFLVDRPASHGPEALIQRPLAGLTDRISVAESPLPSGLEITVLDEE